MAANNIATYKLNAEKLKAAKYIHEFASWIGRDGQDAFKTSAYNQIS
jgi:hypothetical protein